MSIISKSKSTWKDTFSDTAPGHASGVGVQICEGGKEKVQVPGETHSG